MLAIRVLKDPLSRLVFTVLANAAFSQKIWILPSVVVGPVLKNLRGIIQRGVGFSWASPNDNRVYCAVKSACTSNMVESKHTDTRE